MRRINSIYAQDIMFTEDKIVELFNNLHRYIKDFLIDIFEAGMV